MNTLSRETTVEIVLRPFCKGSTLRGKNLLPSEKGSTLRGKNLLPEGANSFLLEQIPFQKGIGVQEGKQVRKKCGKSAK